MLDLYNKKEEGKSKKKLETRNQKRKDIRNSDINK